MSDSDFVTLSPAEHRELLDARAQRDRLHALVNHPHTLSFLEGTRLEVVHQVERWGTVHDRAKQPQDWYWLVGYLSGKALRAHVDGDVEKALHHTVSSAAVLANWHAHISLVNNGFTPGAYDVQRMLAEVFGQERVPY